MKQIISYMLFFSLAPAFIGFAQVKVSLDLRQQPANEVFRLIEQQSGYIIYCVPAETDWLLLTVQCTDETPEVALLQALEGTSLQVSVFEDQYIFILKDRKLNTLIPEDYFTRRIQR